MADAGVVGWLRRLNWVWLRYAAVSVLLAFGGYVVIVLFSPEPTTTRLVLVVVWGFIAPQLVTLVMPHGKRQRHKQEGGN